MLVNFKMAVTAFYNCYYFTDKGALSMHSCEEWISYKFNC